MSETGFFSKFKDGLAYALLNPEFDDDDYTLEYSEYEEDTDLTDDELTDNYDGENYDDEQGGGDDPGDLPQYPENVVIVPD